MAVAKRILLIRHGEIIDAYRGRYVGRANPPLSDEGRVVCRGLRDRVAAHAPEHFFCSPLLRAVETLELVGGANAVIEPRLAEISFGDWEGRTYDEISTDPEISPEQLRIWAEEPEHMQFPNGESYAEFAARVDSFFQELYAVDSPVVAVVTHGGVLMRIIARWAGLPQRRQWEILPQRGSLTVYDWNEGVVRHVE